MLIQCTKKLLDELKIKPATYVEEETLFSWHANILIINRRKAIVLVNDKNRYVIVLYGLKAKDFNILDDHVMNAIRETFRAECIKDEIIDQFLKYSKVTTYTKTKDRTSVARMNKACEILYFYEELLDGASIHQNAICKKANSNLVGDGKNLYIYPYEEMYKDLEVFASKPIFSCKAVELTVTLDLENYKVWRKIIVPCHLTFTKLHKVLQAAFNWQDYHLHEYYIFGDKRTDNDLTINHSGYHNEGYLPILNLVCNEEAFDYENDVSMKLETGIKLSEYLPSKMKYNYDFGDDWQHYIETERVIEDYDRNYPVCLEGEGNAPPEDVGGESGYKEFLEIINDEYHPEYKNTVEWGKMQGFKDFDIEMVNRILKYL